MLLLPDCVKVARQTLTLFVWVRILVGQPPVPSPFDSSEGILNGMWLSLVERCVRDAEVAGSNPVIPTNKKDAFGRLFCWSGYGERIPCTDLKIAALIKAQPLLPDTRRICAGRCCGPQADRRFRRSSEPKVRFGGAARRRACGPPPPPAETGPCSPHPRPAGADFRLR